MTIRKTRRTQMEFWIPRGFFDYVWLANLLWNKYGVLQCQSYQSLFSKIILQIYLASFLLKDSQTFYNLWVEVFPREMAGGGDHSREEQWTLSILQWWWKLFAFQIATTSIPPTYLPGNFPGLKLNIWHRNSELPHNRVYLNSFVKNGKKALNTFMYHRKQFI